MYILNKAILWYACQTEGDWNTIAKLVQQKAPYQNLQIADKYTTIVDKDYPACFKTLEYPPWILFYRGDLSLLNTKCIGVIGARNCTQSGLKNTQLVVKQLRERYTIVSGLAKGIDAMAHKTALKYHTIGIIGCGIERVYPYENVNLYRTMEKNHLILSEYPKYTAPKPHHFPWRNRLIAACINNLIVIEAKFKSGTMHTVNECIALSKPVYCLPGAFGNKLSTGCNFLIQSGANIIVDIEDLNEI